MQSADQMLFAIPCLRDVLLQAIAMGMMTKSCTRILKHCSRSECWSFSSLLSPTLWVALSHGRSCWVQRVATNATVDVRVFFASLLCHVISSTTAWQVAGLGRMGTVWHAAGQANSFALHPITMLGSHVLLLMKCELAYSHKGGLLGMQLLTYLTGY